MDNEVIVDTLYEVVTELADEPRPETPAEALRVLAELLPD